METTQQIYVDVSNAEHDGTNIVLDKTDFKLPNGDLIIDTPRNAFVLQRMGTGIECVTQQICFNDDEDRNIYYLKTRKEGGEFALSQTKEIATIAWIIKHDQRYKAHTCDTVACYVPPKNADLTTLEIVPFDFDQHKLEDMALVIRDIKGLRQENLSLDDGHSSITNGVDGFSERLEIAGQFCEMAHIEHNSQVAIIDDKPTAYNWDHVNRTLIRYDFGSQTITDSPRTTRTITNNIKHALLANILGGKHESYFFEVDSPSPEFFAMAQLLLHDIPYKEHQDFFQEMAVLKGHDQITSYLDKQIVKSNSLKWGVALGLLSEDEKSTYLSNKTNSDYLKSLFENTNEKMKALKVEDVKKSISNPNRIDVSKPTDIHIIDVDVELLKQKYLDEYWKKELPAIGLAGIAATYRSRTVARGLLERGVDQSDIIKPFQSQFMALVTILSLTPKKNELRYHNQQLPIPDNLKGLLRFKDKIGLDITDAMTVFAKHKLDPGKLTKDEKLTLGIVSRNCNKLMLADPSKYNTIVENYNLDPGVFREQLDEFEIELNKLTEPTIKDLDTDELTSNILPLSLIDGVLNREMDQQTDRLMEIINRFHLNHKQIPVLSQIISAGLEPKLGQQLANLLSVINQNHADELGIVLNQQLSQFSTAGREFKVPDQDIHMTLFNASTAQIEFENMIDILLRITGHEPFFGNMQNESSKATELNITSETDNYYSEMFRGQPTALALVRDFSNIRGSLITEFKDVTITTGQLKDVLKKYESVIQ